MRTSVTTAVLSLFTLVLVAPVTSADEAVRINGRRVQGSLWLNKKGLLQFTPTKGDAPLPLAEIEHIRFAQVDVPPARLGSPHRFLFHREQQVSGELLGLDEEAVRLRTFWSEEVKLPRRAVAAVTHLPGLVTVFHEDFETDLKGWKLAGTPALSEKHHTSGHRSLLLKTAGQETLYRLPAALKAGRFGVNFHVPGATAGARWLVEAEFDGQSVKVVLAGTGDSYAVETNLVAGQTKTRGREAGWHGLECRFSPDYLLVGVDERLLWESGKDGPGAALTGIRLACVADESGKTSQGEVYFDDFSVAQQVDEPNHERGDSSQDELWLLGGDQLFGHVLHADRRSIDVRGRFGKKTLAWAAVRGVFLERHTPPCKSSDGEHVRVWLRNGIGAEMDQLVGVLSAFNERRLTLRHAMLGELEIQRARLHQLRWLFHGRRIELDNGWHHLGDKGRLVPGLQPPRAEGPTLRRTFNLDKVPASVRLVVHVQGLKGLGDGIGAARTVVVVNGKRVDVLNRHVDGVAKEPRRLVVALPADCLRPGENSLELTQKADGETGRRESCVVFGNALELPR
jgi:hypothetical protein